MLVLCWLVGSFVEGYYWSEMVFLEMGVGGWNFLCDFSKILCGNNFIFGGLVVWLFVVLFI